MYGGAEWLFCYWSGFETEGRRLFLNMSRDIELLLANFVRSTNSDLENQQLFLFYCYLDTEMFSSVSASVSIPQHG